MGGALLCLLCAVLSSSLAQHVEYANNTERSTGECTKKVWEETVYIGWPHSLSCSALKKYWEYEKQSQDYSDSIEAVDYQADSVLDYNATCIIRDLDNNIVLFNKTANLRTGFSKLSYDIMNFTLHTSRSYSVEGWLSGDTTECIVISNRLNVTKLPNLSCHDSYNQSLPTNRFGKVMDGASFKCLVPNSVKPGIHKHILPNYTATWYKNCQRFSHRNQLTGNFKDELKLSRLTYEHPGFYSCAVTHNGMERFVNHYRFCVAPPHDKTQHTVKCTKKVYHVSLGKKAVIECRSNTKLNSAFLLHVKWVKKPAGGNNMSCYNHVDGGSVSHNHGRATCSFRLDRICFHHVPNEMERQTPPKVIAMRLVIEEVEVGDLGSYTVEVTSAVDASTVARETVLLEENEVPHLVGSVEVTGACGILFTIIMVLFFIMWWRKIYLKIYFRRKFEPYHPDTKQYGAYLSYYFSYDLDAFARRKTRDIVTLVRDELENQGYKIYDDTKDNYDVALRAEKSISCMKQSHRIVVIMTSDYVKDQWSVFTLQKGFEQMIKSETKLIFILLPGMKEYIKQHAKENETYRMIQGAINVNYAIEWSQTRKFDRKSFSLSLELAMPKLRSQKVQRHTSTSSSVSSQLVLYNNALERSLSNDTGATAVNPSVVEEGGFVEFTIDSEATEEAASSSQ